MPGHTISPGDRVGEYSLEAPIGAGGFGEVWLARHNVFQDKVVAAKIPKGKDAIGILRQEGILQHRLESSNIVQVLGIDLDHEPPYLLMEYVEGEDLGRLIEREAPLPAGRAIALGCQILEALQGAHQAGVIHEDLKPGNVLLPTEGQIKLTDFGLGRVMDASRSALLAHSLDDDSGSHVTGTLAYMAPEQKSGKGPIDERTDLYAFGVLLFQMLTGEQPVGSEVPGDLVEGLHPGFDKIYRRCCARRDSRYETTTEVIEDLQEVARSPEVRGVEGEEDAAAGAKAPPRQRPRRTGRPFAGAPHGHPGHGAPSRKSPVVAVLLSLLIPGVGQFYNGEFGKGLALLFTQILLGCAGLVLLAPIVTIGSMIDAGITASRLNREMFGDPWDKRRAAARKRARP